MSTPHFLITIDTEGDNAWARPRSPTTRNAAHLPRFQELCERFALRPTYLVNHEMARCPVFRRFGHAVLAEESAEIGMHLHAWDSPPVLPLTRDDRTFQPFLIEYPDAVMRAKIRVVTDTLENTFGRKMVSHRAGRWALDGRYASMLLEEGYRADCSVTPLVSWRGTRGDPAGSGGTDYTDFPTDAYWLDPSDIARPGDSVLLEVPMTILPATDGAVRRLARTLRRAPRALDAVATPLRKACDRVAPPVLWLRPNGRNRSQLLEVVARVLAEGRRYAEFMLHSSELMPGGSPTFRDAESIDALYADLEALFGAVHGRFVAATLSEFHAAFSAGEPYAAAR